MNRADSALTALTTAQNLIAERLDSALRKMESPVVQPMRHALSGGKTLRGCLVLESARLHQIDTEAAADAAAGVEAIHAYSLVHDDLPAMDDDDFRRGEPTVHKKWDEATAILTGDALQSLGFELVARCGCPDPAKVRLISSLAQAAGAVGMVGGQALDIAAETTETPLTLEQITQLQAGKTGALIVWSAAAGAIMVDADADALKTYGASLGLAFQIWDDVLDVEGDASIVGKAVGKDQDAGKATFVTLLGLDGAKSRANQLVAEACDALSTYGQSATTLQSLARFVIARDK